MVLTKLLQSSCNFCSKANENIYSFVNSVMLPSFLFLFDIYYLAVPCLNFNLWVLFSCGVWDPALHWGLGVSSTGPPGKSPVAFISDGS